MRTPRARITANRGAPTKRIALLLAVATLGATTSCRSSSYDGTVGGPATTGDTFVQAGDGAGLGTDRGPIASGDSPLDGMRGARPGVSLSEAFRRKLLAADPNLVDLGGAAEAYDAVVLLAIATEVGRSDAPGRIADALIGTTTGGSRCNTFAYCDKKALDDEDLDYEGMSGKVDLLSNGDPAVAGFAVVEYDGHGALRVDDELTVQAKPLVDPPLGADPTYGPDGDGVLRIGTLLPVTGPNPTHAAAALAGARVAVDDINARGGVLGESVELVPDESGDGSTAATQAAVQRLIDGGVDAVLGGTTFGITSVALGPLTEAGIILFSPTDTARGLSVASDRGLFFRLAPPTDLEGQVLGTTISNDGYTRVAIVTGSDADDLELTADLTAGVNATSGTVTATVAFDDNADADDAVAELLASDPQAVVVATSTQTAARILGALIEAGKGPTSFPVYGTAANMGPELAQMLGG